MRVARKLREEEDAKELEELDMACAEPEIEGLTFAAERLERTQADIKEQFREVFQELKDALEVRSTPKRFIFSLHENEYTNKS